MINCVPPDHVEGWVSERRDFTDLPLGVARLAAAGLDHRVVDFAFFPLAGHFADSLEQIDRVQQASDAYHLRIGDQPTMVAYLLEVARNDAGPRATISRR